MRRARRLTLEQLQPYLLDPSPSGQTEPRSLDWREIFGNDRPVEAEVGFGKGLFLLTAGRARPEVNFLGIEIERKYQLYTANRLTKRGLSNVRLACADARTFFQLHVADQSLQAIHVFFPDPWWKRRHHKRRLFTDDFARQCARVLATGGRLWVVSDVADYFALIQEKLAEQAGLRLLSSPETNDVQHDFDFLTNFERKYRLENRPIYRAGYVRTA